MPHGSPAAEQLRPLTCWLCTWRFSKYRLILIAQVLPWNTQNMKLCIKC